MQVILKQELQHEQVKTVLDSIGETYSSLTVSAKDKDISLNRDLLLVCSPFLRSILGSLPSSVYASASLILTSMSSKSLINLEKVLMKGSLKNMMLERVDVKEIVEAGLLLGVELTNLLEDFDNMFLKQSSVSDSRNLSGDSEKRSNSPEVADNCVFVNQLLNGKAVNHVESKVPDVQIKFEPEEYLDQSFQTSFSFGTVEEEKTCFVNAEQHCDRDAYTQANSGVSGEKGCNSIQTGVLSLEETTDGEEGEIKDSSENEESSFSNQTLVEETLNIEPNQTEIEELLNATKNEIEKFLVRKPSEKTQDIDHPLTIDMSSPSHEHIAEHEQSSTSLKNTTSKPEKKTVESFLRESSQYRYPCNICDYKTNVGFNIKKHMKSIHKCFYKFKCPNCLFNSASEDEFKLHSCHSSTIEMKTQDSRPKAKFQCTLCSFKTHVPDSIKVHMKNNHNSFYVFKCSRCEFETSQYHKLSNHQCSSENTFKSSMSPIDQVNMDSPSSISNLCMRCGRHHSAPCNHPGDSACDEPNCDKIGHVKSLHHPLTMQAYKVIQQRDTSISLEVPPNGKERTVSQQKSKGALYPCKECGYKTNKASMIKYHAKKIHQSHYLFSCNICMFSTTDNNMFPSHRCKEEVIYCPQCDFTSKKILLMKRHISTQHESQVYACGQCTYQCTTLDSFKKHQLLFCKGDVDDHNQSRKVQRDVFSCDRCDYEGRDIHGLRKHKTTVHANVTSRRPRSREGPSTHERSVTPLRRRETFSPHDISYSRQRTPSSRSQTPNRGPTTPFPPPAVLYLEPAREEDLFPTRNPIHAEDRVTTPNHPMISRRRSEPKPKILLCLRCGRRHASQCKHPVDSWCSQPNCGKTGHVVTLHHPKTANDCKLIKAKVPGIAVNEPSEKNDSVKARRQINRKSTHRQNFPIKKNVLCTFNL